MSNPAPSSNATNFASFVRSGVDPRTGQHSFAVTLARLRSHNGSEIERTIGLGFSLMQEGDVGYGRGWSLDTSHLDLDAYVQLSDGRRFHVDTKAMPAVGARYTFKDQKLEDFYVQRAEADRYHVVYKDGVVEELIRGYGESVARLARIIFPNGEIFTVEHGHSGFGSQQLTKIRDHAGTAVLSIAYSQYPESITTLRGEGREAVWTPTYDNGRLTALSIPHDARATEPAPRFTFDYQEVHGRLVISELTGPTGRKEVIQYDLATGHGYVDHGNTYYLPYVVRHEAHPGAAQPPIVKKYVYDTSNKNFLGYPNEGGWGEHQDNLYLAPSTYEYWSRELTLDADQATPIITTERTYNTYHLLIREITRRGDAETTTSYVYNETAGADFYAQPANLQLPCRIDTTFKSLGDLGERTETTLMTTDEFGNVLSRTEPTGLTKTFDYFPQAGVEGECPADPVGGFVRFPRRVLVQTDDGTRSLEYRYTSLATLNAEPQLPRHSVVVGREVQNGTVETSYSYVETGGSAADRGFLESTVFSCNGKTTERRYTYDFLGSTRLKISCTITGHDGARATESRTLCRRTQQCLEQVETQGTRSCFTYDLLGRLTSITEAEGTDYQRTRTFSYQFPTAGTTISRVVETGPDGTRKRASFDGDGRLLEVERQDDSGDFDPSAGYTGVYHTTERYEYDHLGQLGVEHALDYVFGEGSTLLQTLAHASKYFYDDWGGVCRTEHGSGRVEISRRDPVRLTVTEGIEGLGTKVTSYNVFQMPVSSVQLARDQTPYSETTFSYDGFGRAISSTSPSGATTHVEYDDFNRILSASHRGGRRLSPTYADFSTGPLVAALEVEGPAEGESHLLATRTFDGLGRIIQRRLGGRQIDYGLKMVSHDPAR
ncbi:MAG: hypothetical protein HC897_02615 [Thermoanaerobaculia bacterium]|nr:hypothetical protein [Thermoanaerobaculia bacterium]